VIEALGNLNQINNELAANKLEIQYTDRETERVNIQYKQTKHNRIDLQFEIAEKVKQCNQTIHEENTLLRQLKAADSTSELLHMHQRNLLDACNSFRSLVNEYQQFEQENDEYITEIVAYFKQKWNEFESKWTEWNQQDIVSWFAYKTSRRDTSRIDWKTVMLHLEMRGITGSELQYFTETSMDLIGIKDFKIAVYLIKQIRKLTSKCSVKIPDRSLNQNIPSKYVCRLSRAIMMDPVVAFDGHSYEREYIVKHLAESGTSPITKAKASVLNVFSNHRLRDEIQLFCELNEIILPSNEGNANETCFV